MTELDLVNAIEEITRRLECISLALWVFVLTYIATGVMFIWWYCKNIDFFIEPEERSQDVGNESDKLSELRQAGDEDRQ